MYLHEEFGASPRELRLYAEDPSRYLNHVIEAIGNIPPGQLAAILQNPETYRASHLFVVTEPSLESRNLSTRRIASDRVFGLLWDIHISRRIDDMGAIYDALPSPPSLAPAAGGLLERRMHQVLVGRWNLRLFPIPRRLAKINYLYDDYTATIRKENGQSFQLDRLVEYEFDFEEIKKVVIEENRYYRPKAKNFATVDSFFLYRPPDTTPILFMFQFTQAQGGHDAKTKGLTLMDSLKLPTNVSKKYVVVTPEDTYPTISVSKVYHDSHGPLRVFHHPVNTGEIFRRIP